MPSGSGQGQAEGQGEATSAQPHPVPLELWSWRHPSELLLVGMRDHSFVLLSEPSLDSDYREGLFYHCQEAADSLGSPSRGMGPLFLKGGLE